MLIRSAIFQPEFLQSHNPNELHHYGALDDRRRRARFDALPCPAAAFSSAHEAPAKLWPAKPSHLRSVLCRPLRTENTGHIKPSQRLDQQ